MSIVNFEKVNRITLDQVTAIGTSKAMGPTTDASRPTLYDPLWGYFLFGQSVGCTYDEDQTYQSLGQFTFQGLFTPAAENVDEQSDDICFSALVAKLEAIEKVFTDAAKALPPDDYGQWGTKDDPRCIPLPAPLVDEDGKVVYGLPLNFRIDKTRFPSEIRYEATLQ